MNIYLDINNVLISDKTATLGADELIAHLTSEYPDSVYWLSEYCHNGSNTAIEVLSPYLKSETVALLESIKPAYWKDLRTEAIDFSKNFRWIGNSLWPDEMKELEENNASGNFISVDATKDPEILHKITNLL